MPSNAIYGARLMLNIIRILKNQPEKTWLISDICKEIGSVFQISGNFETINLYQRVRKALFYLSAENIIQITKGKTELKTEYWIINFIEI